MPLNSRQLLSDCGEDKVMSDQPTRSYWICATPRTGGTLLCELLKATNIAGRPEEYFFRALEAIYWQQWKPVSYSDYLDKVLTVGTTPNGVFGAKVDTGDYLAHFQKQLRTIPEYDDPGLPLFSILCSIFPGLKFIWLTRRNKVRQAVSWTRAGQSKEWARNIDGPRTAERAVSYQFESIDHLLNESVLREAAWQAHFSEWGVVPLTLVYEDYIQDLPGTVRQIAHFLGIDDAYTFREEAVTLVRQADSISEEWTQRYREEKQRGWQCEGW